MAKYRKIDPRIWNDAHFRALSTNGQFVFLFVLTHPNMTSLGAMRHSIPGMAAELGWEPKAFREAFLEVLGEGGRKPLVRLDERASMVWAHNFLKYNAPESPNVVKSWISAYELIPECDLKCEMLQGLKDYTQDMGEGFLKALPKALTKPYGKTMPYQEQEQEQEQEQDIKQGKDTKFDPLNVDFGELDTPEFREAWGDWAVHRREKGARLTPTSCKQQFSAFKKLGVVESIQKIYNAIANGYTGVVFRENGRAVSKPAPTVFRQPVVGQIEDITTGPLLSTKQKNPDGTYSRVPIPRPTTAALS